MSDLRSIVAAARGLRERGESPLLATVVAVHGSAYRKPGARMIFSEERWLAGSISAGCLERDVVAKGPWRTRDGRPQLVTYDASHEERIGTGCDGVIDVLIERAGQAGPCDPLSLIEHCLQHETSAVLITAFRSERAEIPVGARLAQLTNGERASTFAPGDFSAWLEAQASDALRSPRGRGHVIERDGVELLVESIVPPPHVFLFGSAPDALPVVQLAQSVGFTVSVCDDRAQVSTRERFREADFHRIGPLEESVAALARVARPAAVTMAHNYDRDLKVLELLVRSRVPYIGLLGARSRSARLLEDLAARGHVLDEATRARLHAPVGLAIGAESPREIALSIVAEIQAFFSARPAPTQRPS